MILPTLEGGMVPIGWDWKAGFVDRMSNGAGLEIFSEESVTPDTTLLMAGPPRMEGGFTGYLLPIGLVTDVSISVDNQLQPTWEIGTDYTYFTRGKTVNTLNIGAMVGAKPSLMKVLSANSPISGKFDLDSSGSAQSYEETTRVDGGATLKTSSVPKENNGDFWLNLGSSTLSKPFGILSIFKTKGGKDALYNGETVGCVYLENCNIASYTTGVSNQDLVMQENVTIMFDRMVPAVI